MSNATTRLTLAAQDLANEFFQRFRAHSQEAEQLALEMIQCNQARLRLDLVLTGEPAVRLLLEPTDCEGEPVEIANLGGQPVEPSASGLESRIWFFGRMSHWQPKQ